MWPPIGLNKWAFSDIPPEAFLQKLSTGSPRRQCCGPSLVDLVIWGPWEIQQSKMITTKTVFVEILVWCQPFV